MNDAGFIKLPRKIRNNKLWQEKEPFDKRSAWIDLLMSAQWQDEDIEKFVGGQTHIQRRGEFITTIHELAKTWRWDKSRVRRFLSMLKVEKMITVTSEVQATRLTICNYEIYNELTSEVQIDESSEATHFNDCNSKTYKKSRHSSTKNDTVCDTVCDTVSTQFVTQLNDDKTKTCDQSQHSSRHTFDTVCDTVRDTPKKNIINKEESKKKLKEVKNLSVCDSQTRAHAREEEITEERSMSDEDLRKKHRQRIVKHFYDKTGKKTYNVKVINERLDEGYPVDELCHIIDVKSEDPYYEEHPYALTLENFFKDRNIMDKIINGDYQPQKKKTVQETRYAL